MMFVDDEGRLPTWVQVKHTAGEIASSLSGGIAAFADNILGGNTPIRDYTPYSDSQAFNNGLRSGDAASIVIGGLEIIQEASSVEAGVIAAPVTDGSSLVVTLAGALEAVHGAIMMSAGSKNLNGEKGQVSEASTQKEVGSYTNTHESGKKYHGKGDESRMNQSAKNQAKANSDPVVKQDFTPAKNDREAFKQESRRLETDKVGNTPGHKNPNNYNKRSSPGDKYRIQDND